MQTEARPVIVDFVPPKELKPRHVQAHKPFDRQKSPIRAIQFGGEFEAKLLALDSAAIGRKTGRTEGRAECIPDDGLQHVKKMNLSLT